MCEAPLFCQGLGQRRGPSRILTAVCELAITGHQAIASVSVRGPKGRFLAQLTFSALEKATRCLLYVPSHRPLNVLSCSGGCGP